MKKFRFTGTTKVLEQWEVEIEADSRDKAMQLYKEGEYEFHGDYTVLNQDIQDCILELVEEL